MLALSRESPLEPGLSGMIVGPIVRIFGIGECKISFFRRGGPPIAELNLNWNAYEITLDKLFVRKEYRRQGYGQQLLDTAISFSKNLNKPIWLYALYSPDEFVRDWYLRNGFCGKSNFLMRAANVDN